MKTYVQSKKQIEKIMKKNGKKAWWTILAALITAGIQSCGSTWNLRENQINIDVKQNCKNENKRTKKRMASTDKQGDLDNRIHSSNENNGSDLDIYGNVD